MKPLRTRLQEARKRLGLPWEVLERDYLLSWILAGIGQVASLRDTLVFKGGTALKKCYFGGDYRFSEDLDFSGLEGVPTADAIAHIEQTWNQWLGPLVPSLPAFQTVIGELRPQVAAAILDVCHFSS